MQVTFIPGKEINTDLGIVNAARVSLHKKSAYVPNTTGTHELSKEDTKLLYYLAKHNHWTPFAHSRLYFSIKWSTIQNELQFYKHITRGGFEYIEQDIDIDYIKGSLYSWINNLHLLPTTAHRDFIHDCITELYPVSYDAIYKSKSEYPSMTYGHEMTRLDENYLIYHEFWNIACATLLIKIPIFIARQVRTSQVGFSYSNLYVEGESFVYNEVSRRYVNELPEFYSIDRWRVRKGRYIKQGSTGLASNELQTVLKNEQFTEHNACRQQYIQLVESHIAPEQLRSMLPQSMYTEFYMTGTLHRWAQFLKLRLAKDVQEETREVAVKIAVALAEQFPRWYDMYFSNGAEI